MTGAMKRGHTLTAVYTYFDADGHAESGTVIQWIRYDNNCGTNPVNIGTGSTYSLGAADEGKHIGVRITPRDANAEVGIPVLYQPWSCSAASPLHDIGPNPVLVFNANCVNASGSGVPVPGNLILIPSGLCSPRSLNWQVEYTGVNYRLPDLPPRIIINWADGNIETVAPSLINTSETNMSKQLWRVTRSHIYDYDAGSLASITAFQRCTYTMSAAWAIGTYTGVGTGTATSCAAFGPQTQPFTVWDTEDNTQLGTHDVNHDPSSAGVETNPPAPLPASTENTNICEDDISPIRVMDGSDFNCTPLLENPQPNDQARWVQFVYGTTGSNVTAPGGAGGSIIINGVSYTAAQLPVFGRISYQAATTLGPTAISDNIQMPPTGQVGEQFFITMRTWNICNNFDQIVFDGNGLNPPQGAPSNIFNIRGSANFQSQAPTIPDGNTFFANATPVLRNYTITIIDSPNPPTAADKEICSPTESRTLTVSPTIGGLVYKWYLTNAEALANTNVQATNASFTPTAGQSPVGSVRSYFVTATAGTGCVSPPEEVVLTRRNDITTAPPAILGDPDVCTNGTEVYSLPVNPASEVVGGVTEYFWTVPAGWTLNSGQGTKDISVTTNGTLGARTLSVVRRYVNPTTSGSQCESNQSQLVITVRANPIATPITPVNICQGTVQVIDGNPSNPFGAITSHVWTGNTAVLSATNVQAPSTVAGATAAIYNLTYTVTNSIGCSGSTNVVVTVSTNPTPATTGIDQPLCQVSLVSNPLGGSNPAPGNGTWTLITKPAASALTTNSGFSNQATPNATFTGDVNGQYLLRWTVVNGSCTSFDDIVIDFGTDPGPQDAGPANGFCGTSGSLNATAPTIGTGTWTQVGGPIANNTTFTNANSNTSGISLIATTAAAFGNYTYRWTVLSGTCAPQTDDVVITFSRPATATPQANFTSCVDQTVLSPIAITGTVGGGPGASQQGRWDIVSGSGTFTSNNASSGLAITGPTINDQYRPSAADFAAGFVDLRLVATDADGAGVTGPCVDVNSTTLRITIDKKPSQANAGTDQPTCNDSFLLSATPVDNGGTGTWSTSAVGVTFSNNNLATATVSNLPLGPTIIRWTASSALGVLGCSSFEDITITRTSLPAAIDPAPNDICESSAGSGSALGVDLTAYNDGVTGIIGSSNRNVEWYTDVSRTIGFLIAAPTSFNVTNGQILFTRVTNTLTTCSQDGQVTFTINSLPTAVASSLSYCEDFPSGSGQVTNNIDLTTAAIKNTITGGAPANRTITWFPTQLDAINNNTIAEITPANALSITTNTSVFARVLNTLTGCVNVAQVDLLVAPRPADPIISGSDNQCVGNFDLYNITPIGGGATYTWTVDNNPLTQFNVLGGGGVNDFLVVLEFPNVYTGDVKVKVNLNGCETNEVTKTITVDDVPGVVTISPSKDPVCENDVNILYTATSLPNTNYSWILPGPTGTIITQTGNQVSVNIGATSGLISVTPQTQGGNCASNTPATFFIDIKKRPIMALINPQPICSDDPINVMLSVDALSVPASGFNITNVFVSPGLIPSSRATASNQPSTAIANDIFTNRTGGNLLVQYTIVPLTLDGCEGTPRDIFVSIKPEPVLESGLGQQRCSGELLAVNLRVATNSIPADQYQILSINNPSGLIAIAGNPGVELSNSPSVIADDAWRNTTGVQAVIEYLVQPINSSSTCVGDPPIPVTFTIDPEPVVTSQTEEICSGSQPTITLTSDIPLSSFTWTVKNITGSLSGATSGTGPTISNVLVNNGLTPATVTYDVRSKSPLSCEGLPQDIVITVKPSPSVTDYTDDVCSDVAGGTSAVVDLATLQSSISADAGVTYTWFTNKNDFAGSQIPAAATTLIDDQPVFVRVLNPALTSLCFKDAEVKYNINPTPLLTATPRITNVAPFNISCFGKNDGQIDVSAQFGTSHTYSLNGAPFVPTVSFNSLSAIPYNLVVMNQEGCTDFADITLIEPPAITENHSIVNASCFSMVNPDGEITISGSGGAGKLSYFLLQDPGNVSGNSTGAFIDVRPNNYTLRIEDENNCSRTVSNILVGQPTEIKLTTAVTSDFNSYDVSCDGEDDGEIRVVTINGGTPAVSGYTYVLDQDPINISGATSGIFTNLLANTLYSITATDSKTCTKTSLPLVLIGPLPFYEGAIGLGKAVCDGTDPTIISELAPAFGGIGNYGYRWFESTDNITFTEIVGANNATFDPPIIPVTTHYKRETSTGTCPPKESDVSTITVNPLPTATLSAPNPVCEDDFVIVDFNFTGAAPFFFDYNDGTTFVNNRLGANNTPIPIISIKNDALYTITRLKDFNGCVATVLPASVPIIVSKINTTFAITSPASQCSGGQFTFEWTVDPDVEYTWIWNDGTQDLIASNQFPPGLQSIPHIYATANSSSNTNIPVILSATNPVSGCGPKQSFQTITLFPTIFVNVFPDKTTICSGETVKFTNNTTGASTHHWFYREKGTTALIEERFTATQNFVFTNITTQNPIVYEVVYQASNGLCPAPDVTFDITVYREVVASFTNVLPPLFDGNSAVEFTNTSTPIDPNHFEYVWEFGFDASPLTLNSPTPPLVVDYSSIGLRHVKLTASNPDAIAAGLTTGCASTFIRDVSIELPPFDPRFKYTPQAACFPTDIEITEISGNGDVIEWNLYNVTSGTPLLKSNDFKPTFKITNPGSYIIELVTSSSITGQSASTDNSTTPIEIFDVPFAAFEARPKTIFIPDEQLIITNRSTDANQYDWDFDDGETSQVAEPNHFYALAGKYIVTLVAGFNHGPKDIDGDGIIDGDLICYDTARQEINAKEGGLTRIPNAFTPNTSGPNGGVSGGGTFNDVFIPITKGVEEFQMQIFDRWGSLIFESKEKNIGWDGYDQNGVLLPAGVYVYKLTLRLSNGQRTTQVGDVTLIR